MLNLAVSASTRRPVHLLPKTRVSGNFIGYVSRSNRKSSPLHNIANPEPGHCGYTTWRRAQDLVARGYAEVADGGPLRPGCLLQLIQPVATAKPRTEEDVSHGTSGSAAGGQKFSNNHETPLNPHGVWMFHRRSLISVETRYQR